MHFSPAVSPDGGPALEGAGAAGFAGRPSASEALHVALIHVAMGIVVFGPVRLSTIGLPGGLDHLWVFGQIAAAGILTLLHLPTLPAAIRALRLGDPLLWYLSFAVLSLGSTWWSLDPPNTLVHGTRFVLTILACLAYETRFRTGAASSPLLRCLLVASIVKIALVLGAFLVDPMWVGRADPGTGVYRLTGETLFQDYGASGLYVAWYGAYRALRTTALRARVGWLALAVVGAAYLEMSKTRVSLLLLVIGMGVIAFTLMRRSHLVLALLVAIPVAAWIVGDFVASQQEAVYEYATRGENEDSLWTLNGRIPLMLYFLEHVEEQPWFGYGYMAGDRVLMGGFERRYGFTLYIAHDLISNVLIATGAVGMIVLVTGMVLLPFRLAGAHRRHPGPASYTDLVASLFCWYLLLTPVYTVGPSNLSVPFIVCCLHALPWREERDRAPAHP